LTDREAAVLDALLTMGRASEQELAQRTGFQPGVLTGRVETIARLGLRDASDRRGPGHLSERLVTGIENVGTSLGC
jgi:hypothetical protein